MNKKIAIISGGGSWGAWTTGILKKERPTYNTVIGTSTGALMAPFVALREYERLAEAYISIENKDIWNFRPVKRNGKIRLLAFLRLIFMSRTLGKSNNLKNLIYKFYTEEIHRKLSSSLVTEVFIVVYNQTLHKKETWKLNDLPYHKAIEVMYASAAAPVLMSPSRHLKKGDYYVDGGLADVIPTSSISKNLDYGTTEIDVFIHRTHDKIWKNKNNVVKNGLDNLMDVVEGLNLEIIRNDIQHLNSLPLSSSKQKVNIYYLYMKDKPKFSPMWFSKKDMKTLQDNKEFKLINFTLTK